MYTRIIVPLDGSEFAERALPYAEALAEKFGSSLMLLRVIASEAIMAAPAMMPITGMMPLDTQMGDYSELIEAHKKEAAEYLGVVAERLRAKGIKVESDQPEGYPSEIIAGKAVESGADLITMTTHGRSGLGRLFLGSVADEVLRIAPCPVLMVRIGEAKRKA